MLACFSVAPITPIAPVTPVTPVTIVAMIPAFVSSVIAAVIVIAPVFVTVFIAMAVPVIRLVSARLHEVDRTIAGVVAVAIPGPALRVARRHMQIQRFRHLVPWLRDDDDRLGIDDRWRRGIAELHLAIDTRADFTADTQVDDRRPGKGWQAGERERGKNCG
jgi:hypothetical protein